MHRLKRLLAIAILASMASLGAPAVLADGNAESPGITAASTPTVQGTAESPGYTDGNAESPGIILSVIIYLGALI